MRPDFKYERELWSRGVEYVVGVDEVGRGCFAGPVYAACVGFSSEIALPTQISINDSKTLTQSARKRASSWVKRKASRIGVGSAETAEINKFGIVKATHMAMRRAIKNAEILLVNNDKGKEKQHLLVDGFRVPRIKNLSGKNQTPIIKGDSISCSIAAASIVAKVERDKYMYELAHTGDFHKYHWHKNKGYGTKAHREAILKYGVTKHHRKQFVTTFLNASSFFQAR